MQMKISWVAAAAVLIGLAVLFSSAQAALADDSPSQSIDLNGDWRFIRTDVPRAKQVDFDDSSWQQISLPHTWNNLDGEDGGDNYYRGPAWYRRHLVLKSGQENKSLFLHFDAASVAAQVFVNGQPAGSHKGMFAAFSFDVTKLLHPGDNVIAVRVDNSKNADIPPVSGDFTFFGGLYRGVHLLARDPLCISPVEDASPGVFIKQVNVSNEAADLQITTKVRNATNQRIEAAITIELLDADGKTAGQVEARGIVPATGESSMAVPLHIDHPHLWNGRKDPYLYTAVITVMNGKTITDRLTQPVGLRFFKVDPQQGFFLNGQPYNLHGVNRHQDRLDMGWAITAKEQQEDFDLIMEMGCTAIRLSHYQHAQEFYDLCDRGGLVVWAEACLVNSVTDSQPFSDAALQQLRELVEQNYNHPSICFWSIFNELGNGVPAVERKQQDAAQIALVTKLNQLAHELDPTRLTTAATNRGSPRDPLNLITDIIAFNRYDGWYSKTTSYWPTELDTIHRGLPNHAAGISEYGAGASIYQHEADPTQPKTSGRWHPEEWQSTVHEAAYTAMKDRPWIWGTFLWAMFDFAADHRSEGDHPGRNDKGLVTYDRKTRKDAFYFYKANWSDDPFAYITDRRFTPRDQQTGPLKIYSNCDSVELFLNDQSLGTKTAADHIFLWPGVNLNQGANHLRAVGTKAGKPFTDACDIVYDPNAHVQRQIEPATKP